MTWEAFNFFFSVILIRTTVLTYSNKAVRTLDSSIEGLSENFIFMKRCTVFENMLFFHLLFSPSFSLLFFFQQISTFRCLLFALVFLYNKATPLQTNVACTSYYFRIKGYYSRGCENCKFWFCDFLLSNLASFFYSRVCILANELGWCFLRSVISPHKCGAERRIPFVYEFIVLNVCAYLELL